LIIGKTNLNCCNQRARIREKLYRRGRGFSFSRTGIITRINDGTYGNKVTVDGLIEILINFERKTMCAAIACKEQACPDDEKACFWVGTGSIKFGGLSKEFIEKIFECGIISDDREFAVGYFRNLDNGVELATIVYQVAFAVSGRKEIVIDGAEERNLSLKITVSPLEYISTSGEKRITYSEINSENEANIWREVENRVCLADFARLL